MIALKAWTCAFGSAPFALGDRRVKVLPKAVVLGQEAEAEQ